MDKSVLLLGSSISIFALVNIVFGSLDAIVGKQFNCKKFFSGLLKSVLICAGTIGLYVGGMMLPEMLIPIGDQEVTIQTAMNLLLYGVALQYFLQAYGKLGNLLKKTVDKK